MQAAWPDYYNTAFSRTLKPGEVDAIQDYLNRRLRHWTADELKKAIMFLAETGNFDRAKPSFVDLYNAINKLRPVRTSDYNENIIEATKKKLVKAKPEDRYGILCEEASQIPDTLESIAACRELDRFCMRLPGGITKGNEDVEKAVKDVVAAWSDKPKENLVK